MDVPLKSAILALLRCAALLIVIGSQCGAQERDPLELVSKAIANAQHNYILGQGYTFQQSLEWTYYDKHGNLQRKETKLLEGVFVSGDWYWRLIAQNGRYLEGQEAEREQQRWEELLSGIRTRLRPEQKRDGILSFTLERRRRFRTQVTREPIPLEDLPRLFDLKSAGIEDIEGRSAYVIEADPHPGATPADSWEDAELHDHVRIWIDVAEQIPVRLHLDVLTDRQLVPKGVSLDMEWAKINNEVWMQTHSLLQFPKSARYESAASNFRKFDVTSRIVANVTPPANPTAKAASKETILKPADETLIRAVVQKGFEAYQGGDLTALFSLFSEKSPNVLLAKIDIENNIAYYGKDQIKNLNVDAIDITNDTATARLSFESYAAEPGRSKGRRFYTFLLVREDGTWKLWSGQSDEGELASELLGAETDAERDRLLSEQRQLVTEELVDQLVGQGNGLISIGDYTPAVASFQLANTIAERLGDKRAIWKALYGLGHGSLVQNNEAEADHYFRESLALCQELGNKSDLAFTLYEIGKNYAERGDYREAMQYYQRGLNIGPEAGKERTASTLEALGDLFTQQGNDDQALEQYRQSLKLFEELEAGVDIKLKVTASLGKIADVLTHKGRYQQALEYYQRNFRLLQELVARANSALVLRKMGDNYALQGRFEQALEYYHKSLDIYQEEEHKQGTAYTLEQLATAYFLHGEYDRAIDLARQARDVVQELADPSEMSRIQATLGKAYLATHQYDQAHAALAAAISNIEELRTHVAGTELDQERFFEDRINPYNSMVELLVEQGDFSQAFNFAELGKARVLYDILRKGKERITKTMTADERKQERTLNQVLIALNSQLDRERFQRQPNRVLLHSIEAQLKKARLAYEAFETAVYATHPDLPVHRSESRPASLEELGALMNDSTAFLEYVVTKDRSYLFVLTLQTGQPNRDVHLVRLNVYPIEIGNSDLALRTARFRTKVASDALDFRTPARQLYDLLLGPAQKELAGKKTLCLVPSGPLWELPFQALLSAGNRYVLEDHALFYVPSLSVLREMRNKEDDSHESAKVIPDATVKASHVLLAVANPALTDHPAGLAETDIGKDTFAPLPEQEQMVKTLGQIYGLQNSKILTGKAAGEEAVKAEAGEYKILHFATHGILDNDNPMYSRLLLNSSSKDEDGFLEAREIMQLELHGKVAVLSACETARGRIHEGEGVMGMSWALFVAGIPTTVVSQWKIDSASTARLMIVFHQIFKNEMPPRQLPATRTEALLHPRSSYRLLKSQSPQSELQMNKAQALRQAALKLMRDPKYSHPFYWAGFVVIGDGF